MNYMTQQKPNLTFTCRRKILFYFRSDKQIKKLEEQHLKVQLSSVKLIISQNEWEMNETKISFQ